MKFARLGRSRKLDFFDKGGKCFTVSDPDSVQRKSHWLTQNASGAVWGEKATVGNSLQQTIYVRSLFDEAISSSQLEGATTTRAVARAMLGAKRKPRDTSERMILNNYLAMQFIEERVEEQLSSEMIMELQSIVTEGTLDGEDGAGRYRREGEPVAVYDDSADPTLPLFTPPAAVELPERMERLCAFANKDEGPFLDPLHKAIILHFMFAYNHPFVDGNGRTARALFYWYALKSGFTLAKYLSISGTIKKAPKKYGRAFLYVETDENDLTYFLIHQLDVITAEVDRLYEKIRGGLAKAHEAETILENRPELRSRLNGRQLRIIRHGLKNPNHRYTIKGHSTKSMVSYVSARNDLLHLADELGLFDKRKRGKAWVFFAPANLNERIGQWGE